MIVIANWKQNKTYSDLKDWVTAFDSAVDKTAVSTGKVEVVIAPSYPLISPLKMIVQAYPYIKISSQDISIFDKGPHTGEVGAFQLTNIVDYAIIGHSERRSNGETTDDVLRKVGNADAAQIKQIVCFSQKEEVSSVLNSYPNEEPSNIMFAYEPPNAISTAVNPTGPTSPDDVKAMVEKIGLKSVIYGGSVDENNVDNYLNLPFIAGFLVGGASLDPTRFAKIVSKSA